MDYIISQKRLAEVIEITPQHLSSIISGSQSCSFALSDKLEKTTGIAKALWLSDGRCKDELRKQLKQFILDQRKQYKAKKVESTCNN